jgi:hypothetical protein
VVESVLPHPDRPYPRGLQPDRLRRKATSDSSGPPAAPEP